MSSSLGHLVNRLGIFCVVLLAGCAAHSTHDAASGELVNVSASVEKVCRGCRIVDLVAGGGREWDIVSVRVSAPAAYSGSLVSIDVVLQGDGIAQRKVYPLGGHVTFVASRAALDARHVSLQASDLRVVEQY